jgi:hypothetical protein
LATSLTPVETGSELTLGRRELECDEGLDFAAEEDSSEGDESGVGSVDGACFGVGKGMAVNSF